MEGSDKQSMTGGGVLSSTPLFVAAAHELKSPLALVRQLSLALEAGDCSPVEIEKIAHQITLTSERALRLTTNLTKTNRLEDSLFTLEPLNPVSLCEEVVAELRPLYQARGRELRVSRRSRPLLGLANRDLLRRIMLNFADNALHYAGSDEPVTIMAQSMDGGQRIRLSVRDFGPAIPTHVWQKLEQRLGTSPQPLHARPESSGLGIYIAKQFAEAMNASIGTTRHRDGATFYVDIGASTQMRLL
jgi:signal transduction histidine kinase